MASVKQGRGRHSLRQDLAGSETECLQGVKTSPVADAPVTSNNTEQLIKLSLQLKLLADRFVSDHLGQSYLFSFSEICLA